MRYRDTVDAFALPVGAGSYPLHLGWHARNEADPAHQWMRALIAGVFADSGDR